MMLDYKGIWILLSLPMPKHTSRSLSLEIWISRIFENTIHPPHFGIIVARLPNETPQAERIQEIINALTTLQGQSLVNTLVIIEPGKIRIRR